MFNWTLPLRFALPPRGNPSRLPHRGSRARLPTLLAPVLVVLALVQLGLPSHADLPQVTGVPRAVTARPPVDPAPVFVPAALTGGSLFAPLGAGVAPVGAAKAPPPDPLGGLTIAGVVQTGSSRRALVEGPGHKIHYISIGGMIAGWRLMALGPGSAQLRRGKAHLDLAYGAHPVSPASPESADKTQ